MRYSNDENCLEKILSPFFSFAPKLVKNEELFFHQLYSFETFFNNKDFLHKNKDPKHRGFP